MQTDHRSTERVLDILELLAFRDASDGLTLTELSNFLQCPKSSISPILHTMARKKYLSYKPGSSVYALGIRTLEIGNAYMRKESFFERALTELQEVVDACNETCHLAELDGRNVLYLLKVDAPQSIRMYSAPGKILPANATALGKALLSGYTREELDKIFEDGAEKMTDRTITDLDNLYQQLLEIKKSGIAYECEENSEFIQCIATPLLKDGMPVFALSIAIPTFRYTEEKERLAAELLLTARAKLEPLLLAR